MARLSPAQRALLERKLEASRTRSSPAADVIPRAGAVGDLPLTHMQRRVWAFEQLCPNTPTYNVTWVKRLRGELDGEALDRAYGLLISRHDALRTTFHSTPDGPVQRISAVPQSFQFRRISASGGEDATRLAGELSEGVFDLSRGPLIRGTLIMTGPREHWLVLVMHHLVTDGASLGVIERELAGVELPELEVSYLDFAVWQRSKNDVAGLAHWRQELAGAPLLLGIRTDFTRASPVSARAHVAKVPISPALQAQLAEVCRNRGVTLHTLLVATWATLLHKYGAGEEVMIGTPVAGRSRAELASVVGFFANTLPLRIRLEGNFDELLVRVRQKVLSAIEHQDTALDEALDTGPRLHGITPGFQTAVAYLESSGPPAEWRGLEASTVLLDIQFVPFDAMLYVDEVDRGLRMSVALRAQLFHSETADLWALHFLRLLESIARGERPALMTAAERDAVLAWGAGPDRPYPYKPVHELFEEQVAVNPTRIALTDRSRKVSYAELSEESNRVAAALARDGVGPGSIVALLCDRSVGMIAAFLGVLKAGAAYLPLDQDNPAERNQLLLRECDVRVTLDPTQLTDLPPGHPPNTAVSADSPAYIMFTSGSTGRPKAVVVPHRGIARLVKENAYASMGPDEVFLHMAPPDFDASTFEIWAPLLNGGHCAIHGERHATMAQIGDAIRRHGVTTLWLTSSLFNAVMDESPEILVPLRQLLIGGEALSPRHVGKALDALPATRIVNGYGPTECTTFACCYDIPRDWDRTKSNVPIGKPIANTQAYILDSHRELAPLGVPGELYLGGNGVALGYWNQPELTEQVFLPDPFRPGESRRLYRTGDRARWLPDGCVEFLGRTDDQVKIRGFRVEPGEVEAALRKLPNVRQAAVAVQDGKLVASVIPADGTAVEDVKRALTSRLPEYMVPHEFVSLAKLPLRPNGKIDKLVSSEPGHQTERELLALWRELLGRQDAGASDDFFALGGDSLLAIRLLARVEKRFGRAMPPAALFAAPTIEQFAKLLRVPEDNAGIATITPGSTGSPLIWLDPGASLAPLAARLDRDRPFYSLTLTPGELAALPATHRLENLASVMADKIERRFPGGGPVVLASFCLRTFLAVETARILGQRGHNVPLVILTEPSDPNTVGQRLNPVAPAALAQRARTHLRKLRGKQVLEWPAYLGGRMFALANRIKQQFSYNFVAEIPILAAGARHRFEPYGGPLLLVRCTPEDRLAEDGTVQSWRRVASGKLRIRSMSGGHVEMFSEPHAAEFARILEEEIAVATAESGQ